MHNFIICGIYDTHKNEICNFQGSKATLRTLRRIIPQTKHCEHCDRNDHTIEECRTLRFHYKYCDRREAILRIDINLKIGHRFHNTGTQGSRHSQSKQQRQWFKGNTNPCGSFPATHTENIAPVHGGQSHDF
jgi:hypothetical protein